MKIKLQFAPLAAAILLANPILAHAQDKAVAPAATTPGQPVQKDLAKGEGMEVQDIIYQPGDTTPSIKRGARAIYVVVGGSIERDYDDGKKEVIRFKTGEARIFPASDKPFAVKNISKHAVHIIAISK